MTFKCNCRKSFTNFNIYRKHIVKHFIKKEIVNCYLCGLETKYIRQFMDHRRDKHKIF